MKIYTKTGDAGETSLFGGKRVLKSDLRIDAYGTVDELNSWIGLIADQDEQNQRKSFLREIQDRLFTIGSELAADPEKPKLKKPDLHDSDVQLLEQAMDQMDEELPEMRNFILPGGNLKVSQIHIARCVCRRAERLVVALHTEQAVAPLVLLYLNRLSDYLFVLSRKVAKELNSEEIAWKPRY